MRFLRVGFSLFLGVLLSQCALEHPTTRGDSAADATDIGMSDRPDVADVQPDVVMDAGPCGAASQRCCAAPAGGSDAGARSCNAGLACVGGMCAPCGMGSMECNGACVPMNTPQNCGACGVVCPVGQGCVAGDAGVGRCQIICPTGQTLCGGTCVSTVSDPTNCGACGTRCEFANATGTCSNGMCSLGSCLSGFENCDMMASNGCETNVRTSATNCGTCGNACSFPNAAVSCVAGTCRLGTCNAGFDDCDLNPTNGCETNLNTSPNNCMGCGRVCPTMGGAPACRMGVCGTSTCAAGRGDCDGNAGNGCETDLNTSATNCGTCGNGCSFPNAAPTCVGGRCALGTCNTGFADCDGMAMNGCETNLRTDAANCGMCMRACTFANGNSTCSAGVCSLTSCLPGFANCDMNATNGCEIDTRSNVSNCGTCTNVCRFDHGVAACAASACSLMSCEAGFGNCDGNATNGCETNTQTTVAHCGACGRSCSLPNAVAGCAGGACTVASCNPGFGNCDGNAANGCETNTNTTLSSCGMCGNACSLANATATCTAGACRVAMCNANFADCDSNPANGCETDLRSVTSCGACTTRCATSEVCNSGTCQLVCPGTQMACSGACVFIDRDTANCGGCGRACSSANGTPACASGTCSITCNTGFGNCDSMVSNGCEASLRTNTNCNACGTACARTNATASCASGTCVLSACNTNFADCNSNQTDGCETAIHTVANCNGCGDVCGNNHATPACLSTAGTFACDLTCESGFADCNADATDGCEVSLRTTTACGACGRACTRANATATCSTGSCAIGTCNTNFGNCDANDANGCEADFRVNSSNCGACGTVCAVNAGTSANGCSGSVCVPTCNAGFANCDSNPTNGCETNTNTSASNCGGCGTVCQTNANTSANVCTSGTCVPTCVAGFADCDGNPRNGCETNLNSSSNCNMCGNACASGFSCTGSVGAYACTSTCGDPGQSCCTGMVCRGGGACSSGLCCIPPLVNCGGTCVSLTTSATNCGACGTTCSTPSGTTTNTCSASVCSPACATTHGNCDGMPNNGCETDLRTSSSNCGACGTACQTNVGTTLNTCMSAACTPTCATLYGNCDGNAANGCEVQINTNARCGACGTACTAGSTTCVTSGSTASCVACGGAGQICCASGTSCGTGLSCATLSGGTGSSVCCASGQTNCSGACVVLTNDVNCGGCGVACTAGSTTCVDGGSGTYSCVACGGSGQPCCATGTDCQSGSSCNGSGRCMP